MLTKQRDEEETHTMHGGLNHIQEVQGRPLYWLWVIVGKTTLRTGPLEAISLMSPLLPGQLRKLLVLEGREEDGTVKVDEHDTAALVVPEIVCRAVVAVVNALAPDGPGGEPYPCR